MSDNPMPVILLFGGLLFSLGVVALFVLLNARYLGFRMKGLSIEFALNIIMIILLAYSFTISITGLIEYIEPGRSEIRAEFTPTKSRSMLSLEALRSAREVTRPPALIQSGDPTSEEGGGSTDTGSEPMDTSIGGPNSIWKNF